MKIKLIFILFFMNASIANVKCNDHEINFASILKKPLSLKIKGTFHDSFKGKYVDKSAVFKKQSAVNQAVEIFDSVKLKVVDEAESKILLDETAVFGTLIRIKIVASYAGGQTKIIKIIGSSNVIVDRSVYDTDSDLNEIILNLIQNQSQRK